MKEKELRIALVCFGGVSLAIYMHGISKEVLKLVRASQALHSVTDRAARARASFHDVAPDRGACEHDTEVVYFDLLRDIGLNLDLRVVVDIVAGASAGGINGTMLSRALCHDLPFDRLRGMWLDNGDVEVLFSPESRHGRMSRLALKPLFLGAAAAGFLPSVKDPEIRRNLSLFMGARWFRPPLDGRRMAGLMYDGVESMGVPARAQASLIPSRQKLDLFVTVTSYHGLHHPVPIHHPPLVHEREHRQVLHFQYRRMQSGDVESDFEMANAAGLAFAARATSSFPGAFPPSQVSEIDRLLLQRGVRWPRRQQFLQKNFGRYIQAGVDPAAACFIDGSVLNNKPFREAIAAIHGRPAYRQVDRRLVYIDPSPTVPVASYRDRVPGFFATLKGAISDLPRSQPVTDELNWVNDFNDRVHQLRGIVEGARPSVNKLVASIVDARTEGSVATEQITLWRAEVNAQAAREAGFCYQGYVRLKLQSVLAFVSRLIAGLVGAAERSAETRAIRATVDLWAARNGVVYSEQPSSAPSGEASAPDGLARWAKFLLAFDVDYRKRRLNFLIEGQNRLYQMLDHDRADGLSPVVVDRLKRDFYACLDTLRQRQDVRVFAEATRLAATGLFSTADPPEDLHRPRAFAERMLNSHGPDLTGLMDRLAAEIDLASSTLDVDVLLARMDPAEWPADAHREVLVNYLGFPYWDVLTLPVTATRDAGEFREILIERISPLDATTLSGFNGEQCLKGTGFGYFAAFLSRAYRENDYLLGRLHAIDRLIDIVCDCCGPDTLPRGLEVLAAKKRAFLIVLEREAAHLRESHALIAALRKSVQCLGT